MDQTIYMTVQAAVSAVCWLIVAGGAGLAVVAKSIHDTTMERVGLSAVSLAATGAAFRIVADGWTSDGSAALALAMAGYVIAVAYKHVRGAQ
ncbi:hypothetical protein H0A70_08130 [Alcaligenaceae bacterium]|nr:hypothetical protein [Alcaligenaceae bacterium]